MRTMLTCLTIAWMVASAPSAVRAQEPLTEGAITRKLVGAVLEPVIGALQASGGVAGVVIRKSPGAATGTTVQEEIGNFLFDRGYEVFTLDPQMGVPEGAVVLDLVVKVAGFDYPRERGGFLGLGSSRVLRRGALGLSGRLEDPADGRWLWRGSPQVQYEDWIEKREQQKLAADRPAWMMAKPLPTAKPQVNWWERGLVAGLLTGVVVLYLDGAQ